MVIGDHGVGKTALIKRYVHGMIYDTLQLSTLNLQGIIILVFEGVYETHCQKGALNFVSYVIVTISR